MHAARGDFRQAYEQHQLFHQIDSTLSSVERNAHFAQLEAIYNTKKKEVENARLSASNQRKNFWIGGAVAAALLLGVIVFLLRKRLIINAKLLETEKALAEAERIRAAELQAHYERELADFTRILIEKNQALEALQATQLPGNDDSQPSKDLHSELLRSTILTDADWRNFRQKFERVHPGFFEKISREVPDATEAERRLAALTRLELSNAEIAAMLGISPESVVKTRYRLRKKLGERELEEVVKI
jgi:DNA-directed RNA polymerase specialized sigma subunit